MAERSEQPHRDEERDLIAKKDVLERTGISYGQFYRWKRKGLIPESWFIRKSTFTGQEAFLPRELILERVETIKKLKDRYSLEEIADLLSPELSQQVFAPDELPRRGWISRELLEQYNAITGHTGPYRFWDVFLVELMGELRELKLERAAVDLAVATLWGAPAELRERVQAGTLWLARKRPDTLFCCVAPVPEVVFDPESSMMTRIDLNRLLEETKMKLSRAREG